MDEAENMTINIDEVPYLLFAVEKNIYGISSAFVHGINLLGEMTTIVGSDSDIRGGVLYQGSFINLIDMRKRFGLDTQLSEFEKNVQPAQRILDHENWVSALEKSVYDDTEFTLTDDPHMCAFGRWFYSFRTDNNVLKHQLKAIEGPHEAVHRTAKVIKKLMSENKREEAVERIKELRATHYKTTVGLLGSLMDVMASSIKELYIVIDGADGMKGIIVDAIVGVEYLDSTLETPSSVTGASYVDSLGRRKTDGSIVIILNNSI